MKNLFGTDGIRGEVGGKLINHESISRIAHCVFAVCVKGVFNFTNNPRVIICHDSRWSSGKLFKSLASVFLGNSCDVIYCGVLPTAAISHAIRNGKGDIGFMISASHNCSSDNGIKVFGTDGNKIDSAIQRKISDLYYGKENIINNDTWGSFTFGKYTQDDSVRLAYIKHITDIPKDSLSGMKIVFDCANGAASHVVHDIIEMLNIDGIVINDNPNGVNINERCGVLNTVHLSQSIQDYSADFGIAFDGDCDRMVIADENGIEVDSGIALGLIVQYMRNVKKISTRSSVVLTSMVNSGLIKFLNANSFKVVKTNVGDLNVCQAMRQHNSYIGAENNGHMMFSSHGYTSDGLVSAMYFIMAMKHFGSRLSLAKHIFQLIPQSLVSVPIAYDECVKYEKCIRYIHSEEFAAFREEQEAQLDEGRIIVRLSGTEPLIRIMCESKDRRAVDIAIEKIKDNIAENFTTQC